MIRVLYYFTTYSPDLSVIDTYEPKINELISNEEGYLEKTKIRALNNLAFSYLIFGKFAKAQGYLQRISHFVRLDPFVTATYGLYSIAKGDLEKGTRLYNEAISMLPDRKSKNQFRQRMNYELGKYHLSHGEYKQAMRLLDKALKERDGFSYVNNEIKKLKQLTPNLRNVTPS
jgi:tetratricopeptide (TPR) repeat protein